MLAKNCTRNTTGIGCTSSSRQEDAGCASPPDGRRGGAVSRWSRKLGTIAASTITPCRRKGAHSPTVTAARPPSTGPASAPNCCTPNMLVIWRPRWARGAVSAMTVMRLSIHICSPMPPMNRYTKNSTIDPSFAAT